MKLRWKKEENAGEIWKTGRAPAEARRKFRGRDDRNLFYTQLRILGGFKIEIWLRDRGEIEA